MGGDKITDRETDKDKTQRIAVDIGNITIQLNRQYFIKSVTTDPNHNTVNGL